MKKWKITLYITSILIIIFLIFVFTNAILCYTAKVSYPYPALGFDVHNWFEQFYINLSFILYIAGLPIIIDITFLIISIIKIKKQK